MKAIVALMLLGMLVGCSKPEAGDTNSMQEVEFDDFSGTTIYKDSRTGCHYISVYKAGVTPRLYSDGVQVCD